jgi:outer membrane protein OmpA-like peptidoglycan-associated protein
MRYTIPGTMKPGRTAILIWVGLLCFLDSYPVLGQLKVDTTVRIDRLVNDYFLTGTIKAFNIKYKGSREAIGLFDYDKGNFNMKKGLILCTGQATMAEGPNTLKNSGKDLGIYQKPDKDLSKILYHASFYDEAVLEFDFIPVSDSISFKYVFGSEEYPEYVDKQFNDVFAFFLTGPGIKGTQNIALLPGTQIPISINTVNNKRNKQYYVDNTWYLNPKKWTPKLRYRWKKYRQLIDNAIQYDGYTTVLYAKSKVVPYQVYHIKIIIADVQDHIYDSGVFLQANSFISYARDNDTLTNQPVRIERTFKPVKKDSILTTITMHIKFDFDSDIIPDSSFRDLNVICRLLKENPKTRVDIFGHTDSMGTGEYNINLSLRRARSVAKYMVEYGISSDRITASGKGFTEPVATNQTPEGRAENRRVVFVIRR